MFGSLAVSSERDHTLEITLAQVAGEPGLLCGLQILPPVFITQPLAQVLMIKQVNRSLVVVWIIADPCDDDYSWSINKPFLRRSPILLLR